MIMTLYLCLSLSAAEHLLRAANGSRPTSALQRVSNMDTSKTITGDARSHLKSNEYKHDAYNKTSTNALML